MQRIIDAYRSSEVQASRETIVGSEPLSSGVITRFFRRAIPDTAAQELLNVDLSDPVVPCRRDGYELVTIGLTGIEAILQAKRIGGLFWFNPSEGDRFLVISIPFSGSGRVYKALDVTSLPWGEVTTSDGTQVDMGSDDMPAFQANDKLWMLPGGGGFVTVVGVDGIAIRSANGPTDAPDGVVDGAYLLGRVWLMQGKRIHWSTLLPITPLGTFDPTTQSLEMSPNRGAAGVALRPWRNESLVAFFDLTIEELVVDPGDPANSTRNVIEPAVGCCSRAGVVSLGDDFYFPDQWGQIRSLKRSAQGQMQGVIPTPLSEPIKPEIPGRVNKRYMHRMRSLVFDDHLEIYYPRDDSIEANARMIYEFASETWHGPHIFADPVGQVCISSIRDRGEELFSTNGSASPSNAKVFLWNQGNYTDDGDAIEYRETTKSFDLGCPESAKAWKWIELEYYGDVGTAPSVAVRINEDGEFSDALEASSGTEVLDGGDEFPLVPDDFPLLPDDFPLESIVPATGRVRYHLDSGVVRRSRSLEVRISEGSQGLRFFRRGWLLVASTDPHEKNPTDDL